jgi:hypothetical protein
MKSILQFGKFSLLALLLLYCIAAKLAAKSGRKHGSAAAVTKKPTDKVSDRKNEYNISIVSWNLAEKSPSKKDCLLIVIGVQECEDVRPRREEGHRSRAWKTLQKISLGKDFICLAQHRMGGMYKYIYIYVYMHMYIYVYNVYMYVYIVMHKFACKYIFICIYAVNIYIYMYTCKFMSICIYIKVYR